MRREDGSYLVDGLMSFVELQAQLGLPAPVELAPSQGFETIAGFLLALLGEIPKAGAQVVWQGYVFEVVDMDGRRIDKILLVMPPPTSTEQSEGALASGAVLPLPAVSSAEE